VASTSIDVQNNFSINSLIWFSALRPGEEGMTKRVLEDVEPTFRSRGLIFERYEVTSIAAFGDALAKVRAAASTNGLRPMIHIDMHGSAELGLEISAEGKLLSWDQLVKWLRPINAATGNTLCIISGACFGLHAIKPLKLDQAAPFNILIAPEHKVTFGFLEDHSAPFYAEMMEAGDVMQAYQRNLAPTMAAFQCERFLMISIMRYIRNHCRGLGLRVRRERLLTEVMREGMPNTRQNRRKVRKLLKTGLKPDQAMVDRYVTSFMLGKPCSFTMDDLVNMVDSSMRLCR
jgi:hypothetical protein